MNLKQVNYVIGVPARGRRRRVKPRFDPAVWNQYEAVLLEEDRTNNPAEGWHNRYQTVVGVHHPSINRFLKNLQTEQGLTQYKLDQIEMGHMVKRLKNQKRIQYEESIANIVHSYEDFKARNERMRYLRLIGNQLSL